ncbi:MAG: hypothetical protein JWP37_3764 [Mucilaginibacter sp.]|nr:hypothetical protein [Mucilaginibacter sp.]
MVLDISTFRTYQLQLYENISSQLLEQDNDAITDLKDRISFYESKIKKDEVSENLILILGIILFVIGVILWFFKIQKPQDELLKMQLTQAKKENSETTTKIIVLGRKHHDPINVKKAK